MGIGHIRSLGSRTDRGSFIGRFFNPGYFDSRKEMVPACTSWYFTTLTETGRGGGGCGFRRGQREYEREARRGMGGWGGGGGGE